MPRTPRISVPGQTLHVVFKGIDGRPIFRSRRDRALLLRRMREVCIETTTLTYAFALMRNHVHSLFCPLRCPIGNVMQRILCPYAVSYNARNGLSGPLTRGRFWSRPIGDEDDFMTVLGYICLNPVRAGLIDSPEELTTYAWTSAREILGPPRPRHLTDVEAVLRRFDDDPLVARREFAEMLAVHAGDGSRVPPLPGHQPDSGILLRPREGSDLSARGTYALPDAGRMIDEEMRAREQRTARRILLERAGWTLDATVKRAAELCGTRAFRIRCGGRRRKEVEARQMIAVFAHDLLGYTDWDIGRATGVARQSVAAARTRALSEDPGLLEAWAEFFVPDDRCA